MANYISQKNSDLTMKNSGSLNKSNKNLGQVDTPIHIAKSLISNLSHEYDFFADLGAGLGNFSAPLTSLNGILVEIDTDRFNYLSKSANILHKPILSDVLNKKFYLDKYLTPNNRNLYISNPPFSRENIDYNFNFFLDLNSSSSFKQLDIAFLDKVMSSINSKSSLIFIISAPFVAFEKYLNQRERFIKSFDSLSVIILDDTIYKNTEVQSYAVIAHKISPREIKNRISLEKMNSFGEITDQIIITKTEAIKSLCFEFHYKLNLINGLVGSKSKTVADLNASLIRGSRSKLQFDRLNLESIHTTDLKEPFLFLNNTKSSNNFKRANVNDILIPRVGKRALNRESIVKEGTQIFTDSVYMLSSKSQDDSKIIWNSVSSEVGKLWRSMHAQGKCAKYLTREAILSMPIL